MRNNLTEHNIDLEHDLMLKQVIENRVNKGEARFDWSSTVKTPEEREDILLAQPTGEVAFNLGLVAETIGEALTDLIIARGEEREDLIFNEQNRELVSETAHAVADKLIKQVNAEGHQLKLSRNDLYLLIEKALIEKDRHDIAKSLTLYRQYENDGDFSQDEDPVTVKLIRRNNSIVPWNEAKIKNAVSRAFLTMKENPEPAGKIARATTKRVAGMGVAKIDIEEVQDIVQQELMKAEHFNIAEHYILYRAQRARFREQEEELNGENPQQESMTVILEEDGSSSFWDRADLKKRIDFASAGLDLTHTAAQIETELTRSLTTEISRRDLQKLIILNAKSLLERDADFARFSGRILLTYIYEEVLDWDILRDGREGLKKAHQEGFKAYIQYGIDIDRLSPDLLSYDLEKVSAALDPSADLDFEFLGVSTLYDRYLIIDKTGERHRRLETPQFFWMRVSLGLFKAEESEREELAIRMYQLYKSRRFCSSTPTLFNSGTLHSQLSSCYLYKVDDSIESIMQRGIADNAYLSKWAGGLGGSWTAVRGMGAHIKGTNGESQGVIPFLKLHNDQLVAVNQGGKRRGSGCAYLETWHNDLRDFLELRKNTGDDRMRTHDMNTANWVPDLFMKRMEARQNWTFFRSSDTPDLHDLYGSAFQQRYEEYEKLVEEGKMWGETVPALDVWKDMLKAIFETGHPWITFKDPCNVRSPQDHVGVIHSSNLCTEITLNTSEEETAVCNLGSVVLENHVKEDGSIDHEKLEETINMAIRALDNVIDINFYPTPSAENSNRKHRPIGMGVMGLQNALYKRNLSFDSEEAVDFNDEIMEAVAYYAYSASSSLAGERGTYSSYKGSKWDRGLLPQDTLDLLQEERGAEIDTPRGGKMDWTPVREKIAKNGMRNSNVLAIAPTATISNIMGSTPCIEPNYKNLFVKENLGGKYIQLNKQLVYDLKGLGIWDQKMIDDLKYFDGELDDIERIPEELKAKHKTVFKVPFEYIIDAAARRQKWIDQSQSVNLFLSTPNMKTLSHMYRRAWTKGLKTTYYLRTLGANSIEKSSVKSQKEVRGVMASTSNPAVDETFVPGPKACSLDDPDCESCQ